MALNLLLEACMRRGEMDKMHGIMEAIREVERKQLRYLNMIWKRLLGITDEEQIASFHHEADAMHNREAKMSIISSLSMREGRCGERESITRQKGRRKEGRQKNAFSPAESDEKNGGDEIWGKM